MAFMKSLARGCMLALACGSGAHDEAIEVAVAWA